MVVQVPEYKVISVVGDSIANGFFDLGELGWVPRLVKALQKAKPQGFYVRNSAVSGDRTPDCLARFRSQVVSNPGDVLIIACGVNDLARWGGRDEPQSIAPPVCLKAWQDLLLEAKRVFNNRIYVAELLPVYEERIPARENDFGDQQFYRNDDIEAYNVRIKEMCTKHNVTFVSFKDALKEMDWNQCLTDDVHPNSEGHKLIADVMHHSLAKDLV